MAELVLEEISFQTLFQMANDAIFVVDSESGLIIDANCKALALVGRTIEEIKEMTFDQLHPPQSRKQLKSAFARRTITGESTLKPCDLYHKDGRIIPCELSGCRISLGDRQVALGIFRDLTERHKVLEDLRIRDVAIDSLASGVCIVDARDPELPIIYVNDGFKRTTGYSEEECLGKNCRFLQRDDTNQEALTRLRAAVTNGESCEVRLKNYRKDGKAFWNELRISPVRDEDGVLTHFVGIQIDVTDRVISRQKLEESESRYRTLANSAEDLITQRNLEGHVGFVSASVQRHLGWNPEEFAKKDFAEWIHPEDRHAFLQGIQSLSPDNESTILTYRILRAQGDYIWMESTETLIGHSPDSAPEIVGIGRDITKRHQAQIETKVSLQKERELNQIKTRFIHLVSHEFRTPLTAINASASFLKEWGPVVTKDKRERHFRNISSSLKRMNRMLDDVLFVNRHETKCLELKPVEQTIVPFCEQLIDETNSIFPGRKINFSSDMSPDQSFPIDPDLMVHILQNLFSNAMKFSSPECPVNFSVDLDEAGEYLVWNLSDCGRGIRVEDHEAVFEPFRRGTNSENIKGTGLGLYIVKRAVERHGGTIDFHSKPNEGTSFTVRIPRTPPNPCE